ncbi:hypothetical protein B5M09_012197 [Aphanomyces astaci]|uniref:Reverse transcriptase domain-containing protein n=1 Tax=Aphanomyces astaci TaxID=112090 RepID=A0A425C1J5_APHAT|nr:hypothetical protein B5M09_012197 [Aphanomyces astaci]
MERLAAPHLHPRFNPGCLLDEHKRADAIYLREQFVARRHATSRRLSELLSTARKLALTQRLHPSAASIQAAEAAHAEYAALYTATQEQARSSRFDDIITQEDRCSKEFFRPPTTSALPTIIPVQNASDHSTVSQGFRTYWATIFQSPSRDIQAVPTQTNAELLTHILEHTSASLTLTSQHALDAPFTARDFFDAIAHTAKGKAPGPDGLPIEYYQLQPSAWSQVLLLCYDDHFARGRMSKFQRRAHLSLLHKSGHRGTPSNYRPLTLLNADAKLGPKILSHRLGLLLPRLVGPDQYGFVPGRSIQQALFRVQTLHQHCLQTNQERAGLVMLDFAKAFDSSTGMRLNLSKTAVMPFATGQTQSLLPLLQPHGVKLIQDDQHCKLLGIYFRPGGSMAHRLNHLLPAVHQRCLLWRYRARTLRGKAVLLRSIILPLIWYTTAMTPTTPALLAKFEPSITDFINGSLRPEPKPLARRGKLPAAWHTVSHSQGGLGLPDLHTTSCALQLGILVAGLRSIRQTPATPPSWLAPATTLFTKALDGLGTGFDILHATHTRTLHYGMGRYGTIIGPYLHQLLCTWSSTASLPPFSLRPPLDAMTTPIWISPAFRTTTRLLHQVSAHSSVFPALGLMRPLDFIQAHLDPPTAMQLADLLRWSLPHHAAMKCGLAVGKPLAPLLARISPLPHGPHFPSNSCAVHHMWLFGATSIDRTTTATIRSLLPPPLPPPIPLHRLGMQLRSPNWALVWPRERDLDKYLLPVFADLKYRLQHNALGLLYKYAWRRDSTHCLHGCHTPETAQHLFWACPFASTLWQIYSAPLDTIFGNIEWKSLLFMDDLHPTETYKRRFHKEAFVMLHFVRSIIWRQLWLHRNTLLMDSADPHPISIAQEVRSYLALHLKHYHERLIGLDNKRRLRRFLDLWSFCGVAYYPPLQDGATQVPGSDEYDPPLQAAATHIP